jgi:hypothetical protein
MCLWCLCLAQLSLGAAVLRSFQYEYHSEQCSAEQSTTWHYNPTQTCDLTSMYLHALSRMPLKRVHQDLPSSLQESQASKAKAWQEQIHGQQAFHLTLLLQYDCSRLGRTSRRSVITTRHLRIGPATVQGQVWY